MSADDARQRIAAIGVITLVPIAIYLVGAFTAWDFDPHQWNPDGRFLAAALALVWEIVAVSALVSSDA